MQKIIPHLWFDKEAKEAVEFYVSLFSDSHINNIIILHDTPSGDCEVVSFNLFGQTFMAINAGPFFTFNPAISFLLNFNRAKDSNALEKLNSLWEKLMVNGIELMPLEEYPFGERYGWVQDKFGLSWQFLLTNVADDDRPFIAPALMFVDNVSGRAEEALNYYISLFPNSKSGHSSRYNANQAPNKEGNLMFADFMINGQWFVVMDTALYHDFSFNEAISFIVNCENQQEIDCFWNKLSAIPAAEQCGWLKDKFGVSWQIVPTILGEMMKHGTEQQIKRVTETLLQMKKLDINALKQAYE